MRMPQRSSRARPAAHTGLAQARLVHDVLIARAAQSVLPIQEAEHEAPQHLQANIAKQAVAAAGALRAAFQGFSGRQDPGALVAIEHAGMRAPALKSEIGRERCRTCRPVPPHHMTPNTV